MYANKAAAQSGLHHPNVQSILSTCYESTDGNEKAIAALGNALRLLPADDHFFYRLADLARAEDFPTLLECVRANESTLDTRWLNLALRCERSPEWGEHLLAYLESNEVPNGIGELVWANVEEGKGNLDAAAQWSLKALRAAQSDEIRNTARSEHLEQRFYGNKVAELFAESQDAHNSAVCLLFEAENGYEADYGLAARAVESEERLANFPVRFALAGYLYWLAGEEEKSVGLLELFRNSRTAQNEEEWIVELVDSTLADLWLELGEAKKFVEAWHVDQPMMVRALEHCRGDIWHPSVDAFLAEVPRNPLHNLISDIVLAERGIQGSQADAFAYGDYNQSRREAVTRYIKSIHDARSIINDEREMPQSLATSLAGFAVAGGLPCEEIQLHEELQPGLLLSALGTASQLADADQIEAWSKQIDTVCDESLSPLDIRCWRIVGNFHQNRGDFERAIAAFERCEKGLNSEGMVAYGRATAESLVACHLGLGQPERAAAAMQRFSQRFNEDMPAACEQCLYEGDTDGLVAALKELDEERALRWLRRPNVQARLAAISNWGKVTTEFPAFSPMERTVQECATVVAPVSRSIDGATIQNVVDETLETKCQVELLGTIDGETGWLVTSDSGDELLIATSQVRYETVPLPTRVASQLASDVRAIDVCVLDENPRSVERLFAVVQRFTDAETIIVKSYPYLWHGEDLAGQLAWRNRIPLNHRTMRRTLYVATDESGAAESDYEEVTPVEVEQDGATEPETAEDWAKLVEPSGLPLPVEFDSPVRYWPETLSGIVTGVRAEDELLIVTPSADSKLHPLIRAGSTISLPLWRVRVAGERDTLATEALEGQDVAED
ncbi:MAG: hypothetical protein AAFX06_15670 [Planctomycetota bacterium]